MLGDSGVGKTSLLVHYQSGEFKAGSFSATVGVALSVSNGSSLIILSLIKTLCRAFCTHALKYIVIGNYFDVGGILSA